MEVKKQIWKTDCMETGEDELTQGEKFANGSLELNF